MCHELFTIQLRVERLRGARDPMADRDRRAVKAVVVGCNCYAFVGVCCRYC